MTKICLYYDNDTDEVIIVKANGILESDKIVKDLGLNPMKLIYTDLKIGFSVVLPSKRKFSYYLKDKQGNLVIDDFGNLVWIEEYKLVEKETLTFRKIKTENELVYLDSVQQKSITDLESMFISFGNNKRKYLTVQDFNNLIKNND